MSELVKDIRTYLGRFNFEFDYRFLIDRFILQEGFWEPQVLSFIQSFVKPGMVAVDVGANAGYHALLMADLVGPTGKVFAFEPNPETRERLARNIELNQTLKPQSVVCAYGLGVEPTMLYVQIDQREDSYGNAMLVADPKLSNSVAVEVKTLDEVVKEDISFIKLDAEGMELDVLKGARKQIEKNRPIIVFETLTTSPPEQHKPIEDFLKSYGYRIFCTTLKGDNLIEISYPFYPQEDSVAIFALEKGS